MATAAAQQSPEMAEWKPKPPKVEFRVHLDAELAAELGLIADVRTAVNRAIGDRTTTSITSMLIEEARSLSDEQKERWKSMPVDDLEVAKTLVRELVAAYQPGAERKEATAKALKQFEADRIERLKGRGSE